MFSCRKNIGKLFTHERLILLDCTYRTIKIQMRYDLISIKKVNFVLVHAKLYLNVSIIINFII